MNKVIWLLVLTAMALLVLGGCGSAKYSTETAPEIKRGSYSTFTVVPRDHGTLDPETSRMIEWMVIDELNRKGYEEGEPEDASVKVMVQTLLEQTPDRSAYGEQYRAETGEYRVVKEATIQILMFDSATSKWLWRGEVNGLAKYNQPGKEKESKENIREIIAEMLNEIPARN